MAIVANILPIDTLTVGKRVAYFDPTSDLAGLKFATISAVRWGDASDVVECDIVNEASPYATVTNVAGRYLRVVDDFMGSASSRPNV